MLATIIFLYPAKTSVIPKSERQTLTISARINLSFAKFKPCLGFEDDPVWLSAGTSNM